MYRAHPTLDGLAEQFALAGSIVFSCCFLIVKLLRESRRQGAIQTSRCQRRGSRYKSSRRLKRRYWSTLLLQARQQKTDPFREYDFGSAVMPFRWASTLLAFLV